MISIVDCFVIDILTADKTNSTWLDHGLDLRVDVREQGVSSYVTFSFCGHCAVTVAVRLRHSATTAPAHEDSLRPIGQPQALRIGQRGAGPLEASCPNYTPGRIPVCYSSCAVVDEDAGGDYRGEASGH